MAFGSIAKSIIKTVSWGKLLGLAVEYGPEIYRNAKERLVAVSAAKHEQESAEEEQSVKIAQLEQMLVDQENLIRQLREHGNLMEDRCSQLEGRLFGCKVIIGILFVIAMILLTILLKG